MKVSTAIRKLKELLKRSEENDFSTRSEDNAIRLAIEELKRLESAR